VNYVVAAFGHADRLHLPTEADLPAVYACPLRLLRVDDPLPRASVVDGVGLEPAAGSVASLVVGDPRRSVLLPSPAREKPSSPSFAGAARIVSRRTDRLEIDVEANAPGHLVVREAFAAGWRAFVDGKEARALRADVLFRAVEVPAGRRRVELRYRPAAAVAGLFLSLAGALAATLLWARPARAGLPPPGAGVSMPANHTPEGRP